MLPLRDITESELDSWLARSIPASRQLARRIIAKIIVDLYGDEAEISPANVATAITYASVSDLYEPRSMEK